MPTSTTTTTAPTNQSTAELDANWMMIFVPNKLSMPNLLMSSYLHNEFYQFCREYFYGENTLEGGYNKPFAFAGSMLEDIEDIEFGSYAYGSDSEFDSFSTPQEWLNIVVTNFGPDAVIVCSDYS